MKKINNYAWGQKGNYVRLKGPEEIQPFIFNSRGTFYIQYIHNNSAAKEFTSINQENNYSGKASIKPQ